MKTFRDKNGNALPTGVPFELDGFAFSGNWLDLAAPEELAAHGITVVEQPDEMPTQGGEKLPTAAEKLARLGLSVDDLREILS